MRMITADAEMDFQLFSGSQSQIYRILDESWGKIGFESLGKGKVSDVRS